ncbi:nucleotidyltransferase domain-containing protein [Clostridium gasigenes]|uniref:type VII toxin-antitoxin system MntA family adenylyltransferase antitoxin n=1 Tax=Clostridium gasigenes TaxID=94869 RepID=UPI00162A34ED|nr:nucleotidyltransferase domain-containing protein [Clostridium gasigenes]MBB6622154.1 nucleotidyltransferase domain-containing protein [Clostridium gasigenes]MBU3086993.1 nucleotidyltransferase domain-containing protein [Clostridium gasigenes]MBU3106304.1 nucleotidyltransferase domain-containing protein [Clostridium gasigenes]MBU3131192.1 nucleotidyltransferase domain-containing protein [Clostridium gasigenes]
MFLDKEIKEKIVEFIKTEFNVKFIYLFGSFARGEGRLDSDIDLAIYGEEIFDPYELFTKANELGFVVKRDVQLIDLRDVSTVFAAQIVGNNEVLFCNDENFRLGYNIRAFKDYVKLNEERQVVIDAIKRDGRING